MLDSAGVTLAINSQPERSLSLVEEFSIGVVEGDPNYLFDRVRAIALDEDEGIWVVDSHESVRHYDRIGQYAGAVGGRGEGPGEARGYGDVWIGTQGVLVLGFSGVLQLFTRDGVLLESRSARLGQGFIEPMGFGLDHWKMTILTFPKEFENLFRQEVAIANATGLNDEPDPFVSFQGRLLRLTGSGGAGAGPYFLGDPSYGMDRVGRVFISDTLKYRIEVLGPNGNLESIVTRDVEETAFDPSWIPEIEEGIWTALRRDGLPSNADQQATDLMGGAVPPEIPDHLPFVENLAVARDGSLWVERADRHPKPAQAAVAHAFGWVRHAWPPEWIAPMVFDLFTGEGEYRGTVEIDAFFEPMAVTADRVYGVRYDEMDVETIVVYRLSEGGP
jgi:hypothetical protein